MEYHTFIGFLITGKIRAHVSKESPIPVIPHGVPEWEDHATEHILRLYVKFQFINP